MAQSRIHRQVVAVLGCAALALGAMAAFPAATAVAGPPGTELAEVASPNAAYGFFGGAVAMDGSTIVVGAPNVGAGTTKEGAVYVYQRGINNSITEVAALRTPDDSSNQFGAAVAISGSTIVVSDPNRSPTNSAALQGAAYIYTRSGSSWPLTTELDPPNPVEDGFFGQSVSISGGTVVVGAPGQPVLSQSEVGAAYIYTQTSAGWNPGNPQVVTASDGAAFDIFGESVSYDGTILAVGAPKSGFFGVKPGAAYAFTKRPSGWVQLAEFSDPHATTGDDFGGSVSAHGGTLVAVGDLQSNNGPSTGSGKVVIFKYIPGTLRFRPAHWVETAELINPAPNSALFGLALSITGSTLLVGSYSEGGYAGAAYLYSLTSGHWLEQARMVPPNSAANDEFGWAGQLSGTTALIGAPGRHGRGAFFLYQG